VPCHNAPGSQTIARTRGKLWVAIVVDDRIERAGRCKNDVFSVFTESENGACIHLVMNYPEIS
jgi:hypothetical protein